MRVVGLDLSLTSTGLAFRKDEVIKAYCLGKEGLRGVERVKFIRDGVAYWLDKVQPGLVALEGYSYGSMGGKRGSNTIFDIGELGGAVKLLILERGIDILLIPPTSLKLHATGSGRPKGKGKEPVIKALQEKLGIRFSSSDQYDAAGLLVMGEQYFLQNGRMATRRRVPPLPPNERKALDGCTLLYRF